MQTVNKSWRIRLLISSERVRRTDRQTDGWTPHDVTCIASRGKNCRRNSLWPQWLRPQHIDNVTLSKIFACNFSGGKIRQQLDCWLSYVVSKSLNFFSKFYWN